MLALLGTSVLGLGAALVVGVLPPLWVEKLDPPATATVFAAGIVLCGLALLAKSSHDQTRALSRNTDPAQLAQWMEERMVALESSLGLLHELQQAQGNALGQQEQKLELMRHEARAGSAKDSLFRLAASLDQLGARLDQRVGQVGDTLERAVFEVGSRVESVRVDLERRFEETIQSIGTLSAEETLATSFDGDFGYSEREEPPVPEVMPDDRTPHEGELALELEREKRGRQDPSLDLGVLETITDGPAAIQPPSVIPAPAVVEPIRPPASIPFPRQLDPRAPDGRRNDADRKRRG